MIDPGDAVFSRLRIWVDGNHNGISEPSELLTLVQSGIRWIGLNYTESSFTDKFGNQFRYEAKISDVNGQEDGRCYDVLLLVEPPEEQPYSVGAAGSSNSSPNFQKAPTLGAAGTRPSQTDR